MPFSAERNGPETVASVSTARAPWPGAVGHPAMPSRSVMTSSRPSRSSPATASTTASRSASTPTFVPSTRAMRVSTLPRSSTTSRSSRRRRTWARRRGDPVPTRAPAGRASSVRPSRATSASRASARIGIAAMIRSACGAVGRSLSECTTTSHCPASSASRTAVTKTPTPPSVSSGAADRSPRVEIVTSSTGLPVRAAIESATRCDWARARALPRVPRRIGAAVPAPALTVRGPRSRA